MSAIILKSIFCQETQERVDEPYLTAFIDRHHSRNVWGPHSMDKGESETINECIDFEDFVRIELWESDRYSDDRIASFVVNTDERGEVEVVLPGGALGHQHASYRLIYEVIDDCTVSATTSHGINLISLECNDAQEREDEIYLMLNDRRVWGPSGMKTGRLRSIDQLETFGDLLRVELWEQDRNRSDWIGSMNVESGSTDMAPGRRTQEFSRDRGIVGDATYTLTYEYVALP